MVELDIAKFPPESVERMEKWVCLACVLDVFTRHLGLSARKAYSEVSGYTPTLEELHAAEPGRPFFAPKDPKEPCPHCGSAARWHTRLVVLRVESGPATDVPRRELVKSLPKTGGKFAVLEEKATQQHAFFHWLEKVSEELDLDDPQWLRDISMHYLSRKEPKTGWEEVFQTVHEIRRSRRLEEGWEADAGRLFLAPMLFDELLAVQYLVSRSHKSGGLTLEGRYTLPELSSRLRNSGYLRSAGVDAGNPADALEQLLEHLGGGEAACRYYYIVDRRELLARVKAVKDVRVPKPKKKPA
jgi:hypothetical protein